MKKFIALAVLASGAAVATVATNYPDDVTRAVDVVTAATQRMWSGVEANPTPVLIALGTFLVTIVYHKLRGKSLRESVEVAATRVTVIPVPVAAAAEGENTVVRRAQARATRTQLIADQIGLENRLRTLPNDVRKAEEEACYSEMSMNEAEEALTKAEETLEARIAAHDAANAKLEAMRKELAAGQSELDAIAAELQKLADVV
jgi:hypothetical protein